MRADQLLVRNRGEPGGRGQGYSSLPLKGSFVVPKVGPFPQTSCLVACTGTAVRCLGVILADAGGGGDSGCGRARDVAAWYGVRNSSIVRTRGFWSMSRGWEGLGFRVDRYWCVRTRGTMRVGRGRTTARAVGWNKGSCFSIKRWTNYPCCAEFLLVLVFGVCV